MVDNDANEVYFRYGFQDAPTLYCQPSPRFLNTEPDWKKGTPFMSRYESIQSLTSFRQRMQLYGATSLSWPKISEMVATTRKM